MQSVKRLVSSQRLYIIVTVTMKKLALNLASYKYRISTEVIDMTKLLIKLSTAAHLPSRQHSALLYSKLFVISYASPLLEPTEFELVLPHHFVSASSLPK